MSGLFKALFLYSSFGPLYAILSLKLYFNSEVQSSWVVLFAAIACSTVFVFFGLVKQLRTDNGFLHQATDIKPRDNEVFSYLTTYIPQFLTRDLSKPAEFLPISLLYVLIAVIYFRLDAPFIHPFFLLAGYRLYEAKIGNAKSSVTIICKGGRLGGTADVVLYEIAASSLYYCEIAP